MTRTKVVWAPQAGPQHALVECPLPLIFFGGARGGGKTDGVLGKWAIKDELYGPSFNAMMFRRTTVSSEDAIERSHQIFGPLGGKFNASKLLWRMPHGGRVGFAYLDKVSDADEWQGRNLTDAWIEEAGQYPTPAPIDKLFGVLRSASGVPVQMILTGNPGGAGQHWIRERFRLYPFPSKPVLLRVEINEGGVDGAVVPSRITDNRRLLDADPGYLERLRMVGSAELVRAWLEGDWSAIEGAFFSEWDERRHVIPPFPIPRDWVRFRSMDWGYAAPFSVGWWAVASDTTVIGDAIIPRGALVRYREWYGASGPQKGLRLTAEEVAAGIRQREVGEAIAYGVIDPAAFAQDGGPSIAERMFAAGVTFRRADNARVGREGHIGGWDQMRGRLKGVEGVPMIFAFSTCRDSIRTIPTLQHDPDKAEDLDTEAEDHCFAAGTLVDTDCGPVPIEEVSPARHRIWSAGEWRVNYWPRMTRVEAETVRLTFECGTEIVCTPEHRFLDYSGEWRYAKDLLGVEVSCDLKLSAKPCRSSWASGITSAGSTISAAVSDFIGKSGGTTTDSSRAARTSTIRMAIDPTMRSTTWNALVRGRTLAGSTATRALRAAECPWTLLALPLRCGMAPMPAVDGTRSTTRTTSGPQWSGGFLRSAISAALDIWSRLREWRRVGSAAITAGPVRCVSVEPMPGKRPVYCLSEPVAQAFTIHGGLIVHNCADEWRYGCMSRPWAAALPSRPKAKVPPGFVTLPGPPKPIKSTRIRL